MSAHTFLFSPTKWLGEGKINLSSSDEELDFFTRWTLHPPDEQGQITAYQEVQIKGISDTMHNHFLIQNLNSSGFDIELESASIGTVCGKGVISEKVIAWEFRDQGLGFEGFEIYEKQEDGSYLILAEYATDDLFRTIIKGKLWERSDS